MQLTVMQWIFLIVLATTLILIGGLSAFITASLLAFIPAYMYLRSIRDAEETDKEPWDALWIAFAWGAISGIFLAMLFNALGTSLLLVLLVGLTADSVQDILPIIVGAVIVAPIVEEFVKPLVMFRNQTVRKEIDELEDGIVYGAACGLGFGATENVLYGMEAHAAAASFSGMAFLIIIRTVSSIILHLVATSYTWHGIARYMLNGEPFSVVLKYYLVAVILHATWNLAAVYSIILGSETGSFLIFLFSIILAISGLQLAKKRIVTLDMASTIPVSESLPPSDSSWDGDSKWDRESKWGGEDKWDRQSLWDSKHQEMHGSEASTASTLYSTENTGAVGSNVDWKSTAGTVIFLIFLASTIIDVILP
ncbi:MAG: PrsW family intramembrane metalloprotease [Candidatus Thermoplasmatota archaeon]|nr:PrsW family intramembrane metalloprotease [Candidatus Thermoplasmatota archaeon]